MKNLGWASILGGVGVTFFTQAVLWRVELLEDKEVSRIGKFVLGTFAVLLTMFSIAVLILGAKLAYRYITNKT